MAWPSKIMESFRCFSTSAGSGSFSPFTTSCTAHQAADRGPITLNSFSWIFCCSSSIETVLFNPFFSKRVFMNGSSLVASLRFDGVAVDINSSNSFSVMWVLHLSCKKSASSSGNCQLLAFEVILGRLNLLSVCCCCFGGWSSGISSRIPLSRPFTFITLSSCVSTLSWVVKSVIMS